METVLIIAGVAVIAFVAYVLIQKSARKTTPITSEIPKEPTEKVDNPPVAKDRKVLLDSSKILDKNALEYSDIDGDPITHVRFYGDVSKLSYHGQTVKGMYQEFQELPIDTFQLYVNIEEGEEYTVQYQVKSNNLWSE